MPGSPNSNNSFIPKRGSTKKRRMRPGKKIFFITLIAYSFVFAALLAAGASVLYKSYIEAELEREVIALNEQIDTFSVTDLSRVQEFDDTLNKATARALHSASVSSVLQELDQVTAKPIQINTLTIERQGDDVLLFEMMLLTDSIDAALFQRKLLLSNNQLFTDVEISEVNLQGEGSLDELVVGASVEPKIGLVVNFAVPLEAALYNPSTVRNNTVTEPEPLSIPDVLDEQSDDLELDNDTII